MATISPLSTTTISLGTGSVSRAGFTTPLFIGDGRWFGDRVRTYSSLSEVAEDVPTDSDEYAAATAVFAQSPTVDYFKIGRRNSDVTLTPTDATENNVCSFSIEVTGGATLDVSYTVGSSEDEEDIATAFKTALDADTDVAAAITATVVGTGAAGTLSITTDTASDYFALSSFVDVDYTNDSSGEDAPTVKAAIDDADDDYYYLMAHDHTETFVLAMAAQVEADAGDNPALYVVSVQDTEAYGTLNSPADSGDILGELKDLDYNQTVGAYHHEADTTFFEVGYVGALAVYQPGKADWYNKSVAGFTAAEDADGNLLSSTQKSNVDDRNAEFLDNSSGTGGNTITRTGKTVSGEWIDVITSKDFLVARINEAYQTKFINAQKITWDDWSINEMRNVFTSTCDKYVSAKNDPNILRTDDPYTITFPKSVDISSTTKAGRVLTNSGNFYLYLAGGIKSSVVTGVLAN